MANSVTIVHVVGIRAVGVFDGDDVVPLRVMVQEQNQNHQTKRKPKRIEIVRVEVTVALVLVVAVAVVSGSPSTNVFVPIADAIEDYVDGVVVGLVDAAEKMPTSKTILG